MEGVDFDELVSSLTLRKENEVLKSYQNTAQIGCECFYDTLYRAQLPHERTLL